MLIINADDYGANRDTTQSILTAFNAGAVTSASLMVFMEDTEFAVDKALIAGMDTGLHLNFTTPMTGSNLDSKLMDALGQVSSYLLTHKLSQLFYNPFLTSQFRLIYTSQMDEFIRLFGREPSHINGHHHMHLCANSLLGGFYPHSAWIRRNFTFHPSVKGYTKWAYRKTVDRWLRFRYRTSEYFDSIEPVENRQRLREFFKIASQSLFELETHPVRENELEFLTSKEFIRLLGDTELTSYATLSRRF